MTSLWLQQPIKEWLPIKWYGSPLPGLPDLCVGKLPPSFGMIGTDAWKVWYVETPAENKALRDALNRPVPMRSGYVDFASGPDATVSKTDKNKYYGDPVVALYAPLESDVGWPWITVFRLPSVEAAGPLSCELGRGVYAYDTDTSEAAAMKRVTRMQQMTFAAGCEPHAVHPDRTRTA